jgi:flagellar export protein FliJ
MKFEFELQPVLDHRAALERQQQVLVAKARAARDAVEAKVRALQAELIADRAAQREVAAGDGSGRVAVESVRLAASASMHAMVKLQRAAIELAGAQQRLAAAQTKLLAARVARKGVDVLKQRRRVRWVREQDRRENAALDDLNTMRAARADEHTQGGRPAGPAGEV